MYDALIDPADREALDTVLTSSLATIADPFFHSAIMRDQGSPADSKGCIYVEQG